MKTVKLSEFKEQLLLAGKKAIAVEHHGKLLVYLLDDNIIVAELLRQKYIKIDS